MEENRRLVLDKSGFIEILRRKKYYVFACVLIFMALGGIYYFVKTPKYLVNASVIISEDTGAGSFSLVRKLSLGSMFGGSGSVDNEAAVMSSYSNVREAVLMTDANITYIVKEGFMKRKICYPAAPVMLVASPSVCDTLSVGLKFEVKKSFDGNVDIKVKKGSTTLASVEKALLPQQITTAYGDFILTPDSTFSQYGELDERILLSGYNAATEALMELVKIAVSSRRTDVIDLSLVNPNVNFSKAVLTAIIDAYNNRGIQEKKDRGIKTLEFIDDRLNNLTGELSDTETGIKTFKESNNLTDIKADMTYNMESRAQLEALILETNTTIEMLAGLKAFINNPDNTDKMIPLSYDQTGLNIAISQYNELVSNLNTMKKSAKEGNRVLVTLQENIEQSRATINNAINVAYDNALAVLADLKNKNTSLNSRLSRVPVQENQYRNLARDQKIQEELFLFLMEQREETALSITNTLPRGTVVDKAYAMTQPVGISLKASVGLGAFFGLILSLGWIYLLTFKNMVTKS